MQRALAALSGLLLATPALADDVVAIQAGTIHLVDGGRVIEGGGTILVRDGKVAAIGADVDIPSGARVVDYGADAVVVPGLVDADSSYGSSTASMRTASPTTRAVDNFDPYSNLYSALTGGVTSVYLAPARNRLIAGQGAVVKTYGDPETDRVVAESASIHGSISAEARSTTGFWEPPVPATVDVGLGVELRQLPRTTMGAVVALEELLVLAAGGEGEDLYGPDAGPILAGLMRSGRRWRMGTGSAEEVRALLGFFRKHNLSLVIDGGAGAAELADELAAASVGVVIAPTGLRGTDFGKGPEAAWPTYDGAAKLAAAGVRVAVATARNQSPGDLRFAAGLAMRGGLDEGAALRAITLTPAELLGVADRVGSLAVGRDADLVVLNGAPLDMTASVVATWVGGEVAWKVHESAAVVIEVDELHLGDGHVVAPGQLLMQDGRIIEVGRSVSHPRGATVVRGAAAMPGMIDALGHLGLEGSRKSFSSRFDLSRIVEPGGHAARKVARAGVTTVNLASRTGPGNGSPTLAYKPAGSDVERMVVKNPNALRMQWSNAIRTAAGDGVKSQLAKASEYKKKWDEYEKAIAAWTPPPPEPEKATEEGDEEEEEEAEEEEKDKKKKKDEKAPARPVTGTWEGTVTIPTGDERSLRLRLSETDGDLEGYLRMEALDERIEVSGHREEYDVTLEGLSSVGVIGLALVLDEDKLTGKGTSPIGDVEIALTQTSEDYPVAKRSERRREESVKPPKGTPSSPGINPDLEPLRQAMLGSGSVFVTVSREDEILDCVSEFEKYGIRPVLEGADSAYKVASDLRGRVAGVLLSRQITATTAKTGTKQRNRYAELAQAGIPVAFSSRLEEGAVELPTLAAYAVSRGLGPTVALRSLTSDAARMLSIDDRVGTLMPGKDADVVLLDGSPLDVASAVVRVWVNGKEIR